MKRLLACIVLVITAELISSVIRTGPRANPAMAPNRARMTATENKFHDQDTDAGGFANLTTGATWEIVSPTTTVPEAEQAIAVDPSNPSNVIAAAVDFSQTLIYGNNKYSYSTDTGKTWTEAFAPLTTADGLSWQENRDPSLAIDNAGNVYLSGLYQILGGSHELGAIPGGVYVCHGVMPAPIFTSSDCVPVFSSTGSKKQDAPQIAVEPVSGNLYEVWQHYVNCGPKNCPFLSIAFSRSTDHGATCSLPLEVNLHTQKLVTWPELVVGNDGAIYVVYQSGSGCNTQHWIAVSNDGGTSLGTPTRITPLFCSPYFKASYRVNSVPAIGISNVPNQEYVYDVFPQQVGKICHIMETRSKLPKGQGGFLPPTPLDDATGGQRFMPAISIDSAGQLTATWFDTRNFSTVTQFDIYAGRGPTFVPNFIVNQTSGTAGSFIGDYSGLAAGHAIWNDGLHLETAFIQ